MPATAASVASETCPSLHPPRTEHVASSLLNFPSQIRPTNGPGRKRGGSAALSLQRLTKSGMDIDHEVKLLSEGIRRLGEKQVRACVADGCDGRENGS